MQQSVTTEKIKERDIMGSVEIRQTGEESETESREGQKDGCSDEEGGGVVSH